MQKFSEKLIQCFFNDLDEQETRLNQNLLTYLLETIELLIQPESCLNESNEVDLNNSQLLHDFCAWNAATEQKYLVSKCNLKFQKRIILFHQIFIFNFSFQNIHEM